MCLFNYKICVTRNASLGGAPVEESQGNLTFLVHRSSGTFGQVNVTWSTEEVNAMPGVDYLDE